MFEGFVESLEIQWGEEKLRHPQYRHGQALFQALYALAPMLADSIRGTDLDPFYVTDDSPVIQNMLTWVEEQLKQNKIIQCDYCGRHIFVGTLCPH